MSELCLECFNKTYGKELTEKDVKLFPDICEGCGKEKETVVIVKKKNPRK